MGEPKPMLSHILHLHFARNSTLSVFVCFYWILFVGRLHCCWHWCDHLVVFNIVVVFEVIVVHIVVVVLLLFMLMLFMSMLFTLLVCYSLLVCSLLLLCYFFCLFVVAKMSWTYCFFVCFCCCCVLMVASVLGRVGDVNSWFCVSLRCHHCCLEFLYFLCCCVIVLNIRYLKSQ